MKTYEGFFDFFKKEDSKKNIISNLIRSGKKFVINTWEATKIEGQETKIAFNILKKMSLGKNVTNNEKIFLKAHAKDIIKIIPLIAISGIPIPLPITPFIIALGKKYNIDIFPKDNRNLLNKKN
jgi:hypothetical protein